MKDEHTDHCCIVHGCKYGDNACSVVHGGHPQSYLCESCHNAIESFEAAFAEREEMQVRLPLHLATKVT